METKTLEMIDGLLLNMSGQFCDLVEQLHYNEWKGNHGIPQTLLIAAADFARIYDAARIRDRKSIEESIGFAQVHIMQQPAIQQIVSRAMAEMANKAVKQ